MTDPSAPPQRQRIAAYAVVRDATDRLLLTRLAPHVAGVAGRWTLPGGGIDHGVDLRDAVVREVYEEAGVHVDVGAVLDVRSAHWVGPRPDGVVEDFHSIQVIYDATLRPESVGVTPAVTEVGGSTDACAWLTPAEVADRPLVPLAAHAIALLAER